MAKRVVDILLSAFLLLVASPVLALSALAIRLTSPGPILFRQQRMGRGFRSFEIFKLRTMAHAEAGLAYTLGPDPRITPLGKWLRRTKLDELPQLWNVLRGEMSLVGPRPVIPELTYEFRAEYARLLQARPGLTDPASLKYSQETRLIARVERPEDRMGFFKAVITPDKLRISLAYMQTATIWSDAVIMASTAAICCYPRMSSLYGQVPEVATGTAVRKWQPALALVPDTARRSDSAFSPQLALLEAAEEEAARTPFPWIRLPVREPQPVASAARAGGSQAS